MKNIIQKLENNIELSKEDISDVMTSIMTGNADSDFVAEFLVLLSKKGETPDEIYAMAKILKSYSRKIELDVPLLDTCGTGGSNLPRINTSTISAFLLASMGVYIAKHGNRAQSGRVGSFDLLESLGVNIELEPDEVKSMIQKTKLGFMFAPIFHPAMKYVGPIRKQIGIKTVFNILGPLSNPANAEHQILGVSNLKDSEKIIEVLKKKKLSRSIVCFGHDGLDEITITDKSTIFELDDDQNIERYIIKPSDFGLKQCESFKDIRGGSLEENKQITLEILKGKKYSAKADMIILNSAFGLYIYGITQNVKEGVEMAKEYLYTGKGYEKLEEYRDLSKSQ